MAAAGQSALPVNGEIGEPTTRVGAAESSKSPNPPRVGAHLICGGGRGRAPRRCAPGASRSGWMSPPGTCPPGPDTLREGRGLVLGGGHSRAPPAHRSCLEGAALLFSGILFKNKAQSLLKAAPSVTEGTQPPSPGAPQQHHAPGTATARPSPRKSSILEPRTQKTNKNNQQTALCGKGHSHVTMATRSARLGAAP